MVGLFDGVLYDSGYYRLVCPAENVGREKLIFCHGGRQTVMCKQSRIS